MEKIDLARIEEKLREPPKKKKGGVHNYGMEVAAELWEWTNRADSFPFWCRTVKNFGISRSVDILRQVKEKGIKSGRYILVALKNKK